MSTTFGEPGAAAPSATAIRPAPEIASGWYPGLIGTIVGAHAVYYAREWDFGAVFEAKVARELATFVDRYDPAQDLILHVSEGGRFLGAVCIDGSDPALDMDEAHLRWFIVADGGRGNGVGRKLIDRAIAFLHEAGHRTCFLTTFDGLGAAAKLYRDAGFVLKEEKQAATWGRAVTEQRYEWRA